MLLIRQALEAKTAAVTESGGCEDRHRQYLREGEHEFLDFDLPILITACLQQRPGRRCNRDEPRKSRPFPSVSFLSLR